MVILALVLVAGLAALTALAPTIASADWARRYVLGKVNANLRGSVAVDDWALSWFGNCQLRGVRVRDAQERDVLAVKAVTLQSGLWHALTSREAPGAIAIEAPQATLIVTDDGSVSLAGAFAARTPAPSAPGGPLSLRTTIDVQDGAVEIVSADGSRTRVQNVDAHADVATMGKLKGDVVATLADGGLVRAEVDLADWMKDGAFNAAGAAGTARVVTEGPVDLAVVDRLAALQAGLQGAATLTLDGTLAPGRVDGKFALAATKVTAAGAARDLAEPVDIDATGSVQLAGDALSTDVTVRGGWGNIHTQLAGPLDGLAQAHIDPELVPRWLAGEKRALTLPDVTGTARGTLDLAALGQAVPALLRVRPGTRITSGTLTLEEARVNGGAEPSVTLKAELSELAAQDGDREIRCAPIATQVSAASTAADGLVIQNATVTSGFGTLTARGTPGEVTARLDTDLAELRAQLGGIFELPVEELAGKLNATLAVERGASDTINYKVDATADAVRYAAGGTRVAIAEGRTTQQGTLQLPTGGERIDHVDGTFTLALTRVEAATPAQTLVNPVDIALDGKATLAGEDLESDLTAQGDWGNFKVRFAGPLDALQRISIDDDIVPGLLAGERRTVHLPEGQADLAGEIDLAVLSRAVPALLAPQRGTEITGGRLKLSSLAVRGGSEPTLQLNAELRGLAAQTPERMVRCEPITAAVDAASSPKAGVEVRRAEITTGFATASAHGSPGNVNGTLKADLGRLKEQLAGIVALPAEDMAGVITASVAAQRGSGDDIAVKVEADGSNLRYAHGAQTFAASRARVLQSGTVRVQDGAVARIDSSETALTLDDGVQVQAKGWLAPQDGTFSADVSVRQADLAYATRMLAAAGTENTKAMTGSARGDFKVSRQDAGGPVQSAGALTAEQLTVDGLPVVSTGKCRWQNVAFAPAAGSLRAGQVEVTSEPLRLTATNLDARLGDQPEASGEVKLSSDLHLLTTLLAGLGVLDTNPGITGTLTADGQMRTGGGAIDVSGQADVVNFTVPDAPSEAPRSAKFAYAARVDTERQSVGLQTFKLDSTLANLNLKGSIGYGARARTVALTGDYRLVWADVLPVIYALAPELRDQIALTGTSADKVQISGSLPEGETESVLSGLVARTGVGWETAQVLGVDLGRTDLAPTLRKG
ncbi:MAG TPA: hypothetical protein P5572_06445, partial [Phycisphaerae bacterium]|nr:hypothetical protein [Phycisphaerae bacterium]